MIKIGFTGTQSGMSKNQKHLLKKAFNFFENEYNEFEFHHGDCIGADSDAHFIAQFHNSIIIIHPPTISKKRAWCKADRYLPSEPYLKRNHNIVECVDILIAAPKTHNEKLRSGTWSTIRYARKCNKEIIIL